MRNWRHLFGVTASLWMVGLWAAAVAGQSRPAPGDPLAGVTARQFGEFRLGLDDFLEVETPEDGLGPAFNATSCAACHNVPVIGGGGLVLETRVGYRNEDGTFRGLTDAGDTLMHLFSTPSHTCQPLIPSDVTVIARRAPIPLFGAGLVEAIPDDLILGLEDPFDRDRDGVSGRAALVEDAATGALRVGRFGWKAQHATLLAFAADAYINEMGISNDLFPRDAVFGITPEQMNRCDATPDPEDIPDRSTGRRGIDNFESFMRLLARCLPAWRPPRRGKGRRSSRRSAARRATCRCCAPAARPIRCSTVAMCRSTRICCCTTSVRGTVSGRERHSRRRSGRRRSGDCGCDVRCCTTGAPRRLPTRSPGIATKPRHHVSASNGSRPAIARA